MLLENIIINSNFKLRPFCDEDYEGIVSLRNSLYPKNPKTVKMVKHKDKTHQGKIKSKRFVYEANGKIIVCAGYEQYLESYHPQKFVIYIQVNNNFTNKGYGGNSFDFLMEKLKPFDPIKITTQINEIHKKAIKFIENRGFKMSLKEQVSSLNLAAFDPSKYSQKIDSVLKRGFNIINLREFRKQDNQADYKCWELEKDVAPDMPWTDPITIPEFDHYKDYMLANPRFNPESWFIVLKENMVVGINNIWETPIKTVASTGLTGVRKQYRKRGIATALKHTSLAWAKQNGYESIKTVNAASNKTMLNINLKIGFKFFPSWLVYDKVLNKNR